MFIIHPRRALTRALPIPRAVLLAMLAVTFAAPAQAAEPWTGVHKAADQNAAQHRAALLTGLQAGRVVKTSGGKLADSAGIAIDGDRIFAPAMVGADTFSTTADDVSTMKAFDLNLHQLWESVPLDLGLTVSFGSASSPAVDAATGAVYAASGRTVYRFNPATGAIVWGTQLNDANTSHGAMLDIVNGSPTVGDTFVYQETYYGGFGGDPQKTLVVALNKTTGAVAWKANNAGMGTDAPTYVKNGANEFLYVASQFGVAAYNAATGAVIWKSSTVAAPWTTNFEVWAGLTHDSGRIYGVTYDFFNDATEVFCADATTGALVWKKAGLVSDTPPIVLGGKVYVHGGDLFFGPAAKVGVFDAATGNPVTTINTGGASFKGGMVATTDRLFIQNGSRLFLLNIATGAEIAHTDAFFSGPCAMDDAGNLYLRAGGELWSWRAVWTNAAEPRLWGQY